MFEQLHNFLSTTPFTDYRIILLLVGVGAIVGFINTIAGMATAISYGLFMMMGLPINVANGTTRVGVLLQFITTSVIFKKKGYLDMKTGWNTGWLRSHFRCTACSCPARQGHRNRDGDTASDYVNTAFH